MKKRIPILALATLCTAGGSSAKDWDFTTDYLQISVNDQGYITSMKNRTASPQREFAHPHRPSPVLSLYDESSRKYLLPVKASYRPVRRLLRLSYANGVQADVRIDTRSKYIRLQLADLQPRDKVDAVQWGTLHTNISNLFGEIIGVARDTSEAVNYSIGLLALDDNTLGGTADLQGDAAPFQYVIHTPDKVRFPLPENLHEGQVFTLGGDGVSDVAFYSHKEPYYRILYGNAAYVNRDGQISLNYFSRDRERQREVLYSLIPNMPANTPNHIEVEPVPGVNYIGSAVALWGSPDSTALMDVIQDIVKKKVFPIPPSTANG